MSSSWTTYRNPTLLAKTITALDHVSEGRATLGIGAGWFELEHQSLGYEFGTFTDRFEKLEEALQIIVAKLRGERVTFAGKHYQVTDAVNSPAPISRIPIMIGGSGEKKTLRMVAQYADESNLSSGSIDEIPRKLDALAAISPSTATTPTASACSARSPRRRSTNRVCLAEGTAKTRLSTAMTPERSSASSGVREPVRTG